MDKKGRFFVNPFLIVVIAALLLAAAFIITGQFSRQRQEEPQPTMTAEPTQPQRPEAPETVVVTAQPTEGDPDAPVTIVEFSEFYCPFCARFAWETKPRIEKDYIAKGLVKFVYRNLVVHGPPALLAAVAGECAHEQGKFWDYHDRLFEAVFPGKSISRHQELEVADLKGLASEVGLDPEEFNACLEGYDIRFNSCFFDYNSCVTAGRDQEECETEFNDCLAADVMFQKVLEDQEELWRLIAQLPPEEQAKAQRLGTPTFFINGHILIGAQPYENFKRLIDRELAEAQGG